MRTLTVGGLFDGAGLLAYGLHLAGLEHRWLCEKDEFRAGILERRFPGVPVYRDVQDVGADAERVDIIAGGFPCKGASVAGQRAGFGHPETALWREQLRIIRELRPRYVLVENVAALLTMRPPGGQPGDLFSEVVGGLAACGYDTEWDCFPAAAFGAPHGRDRVFVTAVADPARDAEGRSAAEPRADRERAGSRVDAAGDAGEPRLERSGAAGPAAERPGVAADAARVDGRNGLRPGGTGGVGRRRPGDEDGEDGAAADAVGDRVGQHRLAEEDGTDGGVDVEHRDDVDGRGAGVEWGEYEPAIRRWEVLVGRAAPQPLVRRVDDGRPRGVDRSRLSALGDGVLVQAGWLVGRRIVEHHRETA